MGADGCRKKVLCYKAAVVRVKCTKCGSVENNTVHPRCRNATTFRCISEKCGDIDSSLRYTAHPVSKSQPRDQRAPLPTATQTGDRYNRDPRSYCPSRRYTAHHHPASKSQSRDTSGQRASLPTVTAAAQTKKRPTCPDTKCSKLAGRRLLINVSSWSGNSSIKIPDPAAGCGPVYSCNACGGKFYCQYLATGPGGPWMMHDHDLSKRGWTAVQTTQ